MRQTWWGRPRWLWGLELAVIACFGVVVVLTDRSSTRIIAAGVVVVRVVIMVIQVGEWRTRQRRAAEDARNDGVRPTR